MADYALLHLGEQIGKSLTMRVFDVMLKGGNNPIINISGSVKNCILGISIKLVGVVSVADNDDRIMGFLKKQHLLKT